MSKIRKALMAGLGAAGSVIMTRVVTEMPSSVEGWSVLLGAAIATGLAVGWAAYRVPNTSS